MLTYYIFECTPFSGYTICIYSKYTKYLLFWFNTITFASPMSLFRNIFCSLSNYFVVCDMLALWKSCCLCMYQHSSSPCLQVPLTNSLHCLVLCVNFLCFIIIFLVLNIYLQEWHSKLLFEVFTKCLPQQSSSENLHLPVWKWLHISFNSIWLSLTWFIKYHFVLKTSLHIEQGNETSCGSVCFSLIWVFNRLGLFPW